MISIHALREEGDVVNHNTPLETCVFLSTPSARRATLACLGQTEREAQNFYPRPPRGGRPRPP